MTALTMSDLHLCFELAFLWLSSFRCLYSSFLLSYHQKYLLRQQRDVLQALSLSDEELIRSHAACRLNGYCGGYGKLDELEKELPQFNLPADAQQQVRMLTQRGPQM